MFEKKKGHVEKFDETYFDGLIALREKENDLGLYAILAPDMETLRNIWARLNAPLVLDETRVQHIGIFAKGKITDASS